MIISQIRRIQQLHVLLHTLRPFNPVAVGTVIASTNFIFTWVNLMLVDRIGRRRILLCIKRAMALSLALAAVIFYWIPVNHDLTLPSNNIGWARSWKSRYGLWLGMSCFGFDFQGHDEPLCI
jgi:hypothetical protein